MAIEPGTAGIAGALFVLSNVVVFWFREWRKSRTWRTNGKDLGEIKSKVKGIDEKVGETKIKIAEIQVAVDAQKAQCEKTVSRFDEEIRDQRRELIDIARVK